MRIVRKVLSALTLLTASLAAAIFPVMLFAIQGFGRMDLELVVTLVCIYLIHPIAIALILLVSVNRIAKERSRRRATGFIGLNLAVLLVLALSIRAGFIQGDWALPLAFALPSALFLLNRFLGALPGSRRGIFSKGR